MRKVALNNCKKLVSCADLKSVVEPKIERIFKVVVGRMEDVNDDVSLKAVEVLINAIEL